MNWTIHPLIVLMKNVFGKSLLLFDNAEGCVLYMLLSPPFDAIIFPHSSLTIPQRLRGYIPDVWSIAMEALLDVSRKVSLMRIWWLKWPMWWYVIMNCLLNNTLCCLTDYILVCSYKCAIFVIMGRKQYSPFSFA